MTPKQVRKLAEACAQVHPRYELFVLIQGFCGLRPGEAVELRRRDIQTRDGHPRSVTARGTHTVVSGRFLAAGESRRRPLKGRGERATRTIPIPAEFVPFVERHLAQFVSTRGDAHMFTTPDGRQLHMSNFQRECGALPEKKSSVPRTRCEACADTTCVTQRSPHGSTPAFP